MMIKIKEQRSFSRLYKTTGFYYMFSSGTFPGNLGFKDKTVYMSVPTQVIGSIYHLFSSGWSFFASDTRY